ncbi:hypothetical protein [Paenibacillus sp. E194]|uniref:hypothetical protein n=1 Tax=Paenibacillus sp. E194 TaxID=1458845 RepID=UPI000B09EBF5|nr:hypothetical protein [Paenibacillus sp. E194]
MHFEMLPQKKETEIKSGHGLDCICCRTDHSHDWRISVSGLSLLWSQAVRRLSRMYYTIDRPAGTEFTDDDFARYDLNDLKGFLTNSRFTTGFTGQGKNKSQIVGKAEFEPVNPFSRTLTLTFSEWLDNGEKVFYTISFGFEANKAMKSLKGHYELEEYPRFSESAKLYVNGKEVESTMRLSGTSKIFQLEFDVLPTDKIESIDLELVNF